MKIALLGYGKMGKVIEDIALSRGHAIVARIGASNRHELDALSKSVCDAVIEFSRPEAALSNVLAALGKGIPTVCGTTAWLHDIHKAEAACLANDTAFLHASNFSLGVNLFFALNKKLAALMAPYQSEYACLLTEEHHVQKLDAPSGTAVKLAQDILPVLGKKNWVLGASTNEDELAVVALREEGVPGTHWVRYESEVDILEIKHEAKSRAGFALGAVLAAEWLSTQKGVKTLDQMLGL
jgi:4-hydroxy-tetrahydrodipicolinate reductase